MMSNPLWPHGPLPSFSSLRPEAVEPAIDDLLENNRRQLAELLDGPADFDWHNLIEPLEILEDRLHQAWAPVSHLNSVVNSEPLRAAYNACLPKLSDYATELGHNEALYLAYRQVASREGLTPPQRKLLDNALRDFHLAGVDLPAEKKARFKAISQELARLTAKFSENLLDATMAWSRAIEDRARLAGLPSTAMELFHQTAAQRGQEGWLLTLEMPSYLPVMTYADDRELRRGMYTAYVSRASELFPAGTQWDNGAIMEQILGLRHELAQLLGCANYVELSLATKMATSPQQVLDFLHDLARRSRPQAERELQELADFARERFAAPPLEAWDIAYYAEKLRQERYAFCQEDLRPYFPVPRVLDGLFGVVGRLFGLHIVETQGIDTWHPEVRFFEVRDAHGALRGHFYLDLYARPNKRGGAWMDDCVNRLAFADREQWPVAFLTCNFTPPVGDKPSLLTHDEVETLFHEFGHGLHHMLTLIDYPAIGGINGVAWDAVELPSQIMENWCWEREALARLSGHWQSGEPIPDELYAKLRAAKNFHSGMQMLRQLEFALFDLRIHLEYDPTRGGRIYPILEEVRQEVAVVRPPAFNRFPHGFSHIFSGGYAAGYYSYKWAEVLSADAFSRFEEEGIFDPGVGAAFMREILEKGGSEDAMALFVRFRGRPPTIDALLRHSGIAG